VSDTTNPADQTKKANEDVRLLLQRARAGDQSTLPQLRAVLQVPGNIDRLGGNFARNVQYEFIRNLGGKDLVFREALMGKVDVLRREIAGPSPTPIEQLLADRAVACWLQVQDADWRYTRLQESLLPNNAQSEYHQKRMDRAHTRYLSALKTLAQVRKLAVPVLQLDIAKKQVNVAHMTTPAQ
jgi:hypothetical protein